MPYSSIEGKAFARDFFADKPLTSVIDVGPGAGTYADLLGADHPDAFSVAVEIWAPYVGQFRLAEKYDEVVIADVGYFDWDYFGPVDLVIFGDVLEHMDRENAERVLAKAARVARYVLVSLPIVDYPQGPELGNPYEAHVAQYSPESVRALLEPYPMAASWEGDVVGSYIIEGGTRAR